MNFTASHNPPEYQGIKFSTADGAPALPEVTKQIEEGIVKKVTAQDKQGGKIEDFDPRPAYLDDLKTKIRFDVIAAAKGRYAYDAIYGTGRGYLDKCLRDHGIEVETLHDWRDVTFGGQPPEPGEEHLDELRTKVTSEKLTLGLATDGDGDRFGVIDSERRVYHAEPADRVIDRLFGREPRLDAGRGTQRGDIAPHRSSGKRQRFETLRNAGRFQIHRRIDK